MKMRKNHSESGFTLIEVIITLVVVAIVAAMMASYFGTSITQSSLPFFRLNAAEKLNRIMEIITTEYDQIPRWSPGTPYITGSTVIPTPTRRQEPYGYQYICTSPGTSGLKDATVDNEPGWPVPGTTVSAHVCLTPPDALCTVTDNGVIWQLYAAAPTLMALQTKIGLEGSDYTQTFGSASTSVNTVSYRVIQNRFIKFVGGNEVAIAMGDSEYGRYLKVTIGLPLSESNRTDETLTTLFVLR